MKFVPFNIENYNNLLGNGVNTPCGYVKFGENQFANVIDTLKFPFVVDYQVNCVKPHSHVYMGLLEYRACKRGEMYCCNTCNGKPSPVSHSGKSPFCPAMGQAGIPPHLT